jgi:hypothetical protein
MRIAAMLIAGSLVFSLVPAQCQDNPADSAVYKVEFNIRDGSDAAKTGRHYTLLVDGSGKGRFRVGEKIPYATNQFQPGVGGSGMSPAAVTQFTYLDVGVNIECRVRELNGRISLTADLDISTISPPPKGAGTTPNPTVAAIQISGVRAMLSPGKPAMVASIDDPVTGRRFEVEATVTKVI